MFILFIVDHVCHECPLGCFCFVIVIIKNRKSAGKRSLDSHGEQMKLKSHFLPDAFM